MILSVCGYNCSGSSALIHLLREYDNTKIINFECMMFDLPDGVRDLDYAYHAGGSYFRIDRAFERYKKLIHNHRYIQKYSAGDIDELTRKYIDQLSGCAWQGRSIYDYLYHDSVNKLLWFSKRMSEKIIYKINKNIRAPFTNRVMRMNNPEIDFYEVTKKYMDSVTEIFGGELGKVNIYDQLIPPTNSAYYLKYLNDGYAVVVERDPRDMFLNLNLGVDCRCVPLNVDDFIAYYRIWKKTVNDEMCSNVIHIYFEDLIYKYNDTLAVLEKKFPIGNHAHMKKFFLPEKSINNTQIFKRVEGFEKAVDKIENELSEFLYTFDSDISPEGKKYVYNQYYKSYVRG